MGTPWLLTLSLLRNIRDLVVIMQSAHSKSKAGFTPQPPPKTADQKTLEDKTRISMEQCLTPVYPHGRLKEYFKYPAHSILKLMSLAETSPGFETSAYGVIQAVLSTTFNPSDRGWVVKPQPRLVSRNQVQTVYEQLFRADASDGDPSDETFPDLEADKDDWFVDGDTSYNEIIIEEGRIDGQKIPDFLVARPVDPTKINAELIHLVVEIKRDSLHPSDGVGQLREYMVRC